MLQTKKINENVVAVSCSPAEIFVRTRGKEQFGKEKQLLSFDPNGNLIIDKTVADEFGVKIKILEN